MTRLLAHGDEWTQLAVQGLCARGHHRQFVRATGCPAPSRMVSKKKRVPNQTSKGARTAQLSESLIGTLLHSRHCTRARHENRRAPHLLSYEDLGAWGGDSWRWQLPDLPSDLQAAVGLLILPVNEVAPLLPGQMWHIKNFFK